MQNAPHRHHYIPKFYLKRWAGPDGRVERYTKPIPSKLDIRRVPLKAVGWWDDLYKAPEDDPSDQQHLELGFFAGLDNRAALVLDKLNQDSVPELSAQEISIWSTFLMSLMHRTPDTLSAIKDAGERLWTDTLPEVEARFDELRGENDPTTFAEYRATLTSSDPEKSLLRALPRILTNPRIGTFLIRLHWRVLDRSTKCPKLLLSDDPLARTNGLKKADGHVAMPISPSRLLIGAYERRLADHFAKSDPWPLFTAMNKWVVEGARHFVVASDRSQSRFIGNRFGTHLKEPLGEGVGRRLRDIQAAQPN